jgi:peptidoglycan/xylan/chitin deacetylase (PgdA/CDA1 family)
MLALTYDDGPDPVWTEKVLSTLSWRGASATFFVDVTRARENSKWIEAMLTEGHEVGLHCVRHVRHTDLDAGEIAREVEVGLAVLADLGVRPTAWRAPWGIETEATRALAAEHGLELWAWSFDSHDWRGDSAAEMLAALATQGGLKNGEVVLMHDGIGPGARREDCDETVRLTEALLESASAAGLRAATVSELGAERVAA